MGSGKFFCFFFFCFFSFVSFSFFFFFFSVKVTKVGEFIFLFGSEGFFSLRLVIFVYPQQRVKVCLFVWVFLFLFFVCFFFCFFTP